MISQLISHIWKKESRSPVWAKSVLTNVFLGFAALMMLAYVLIAGVAMDKLVREFFPDNDPLVFVNGFILYYFLVEFMLRFFLQNVPVLEIQPYLHLPIKKGKIIHFMFRKSLFSAFNLLAVLLFLPFSILRVGADYGAVGALGWLASIVGLSITLHFVVILFKKKMNDIPNLFIGLIVFVAALVALDYFNIVSFSDLSSAAFGFIVEQPALGAIPMVLALVFYRLNYNFLVKNTYPEELAIKKESKVSGDFGFLKQYGRMGELIQLELKLILRHKRPRNTLIMSGFLLLYGLFFYTNDNYQEMEFIFMFAGVFITGIFFINYGQFLLSWESGYFDFILTRRVSYRQFIESKYWLFVATSTIAFVVSLAYGYFGWKIVLINLAAYLFNIGLNVFAVMRLAMFNPKKIDLNKGAAFNYEGVGAAQFLIMIPIMILPYILYAPFLIFGYEDLGLFLTGLAGLIGFLFRDKMLNALTQFFISRRHKFAASFRSQ
tara:strand:+ start:876 stop:2348 length:1473 start_codon:yes stop_codon:yes gene_type:complete